MTYPSEITEEVLQKNAHITDEEIQRDIDDTRAEIVSLEQQSEGYQLIADANPSSPDGKMAYFRQIGAEQGITKRRAFVVFLEALLKARQETTMEEPNEIDG
ncbi:MAG: hypothetical protein KDK05_06605 [Candidatus Competibacteraceae bacterium]|nr:hypothetical protein [Candidatus Competibacteraceae bacterium]